MYYLGFLKHNTKDIVVFKSPKKPQKGDFRYFLRVMGPYDTEGLARNALRVLQKRGGYRENPRKKGASCLKGHVHNGRCVRSENPSSGRVAQAVRLTKKLIRAYEAFRKENPGEQYHGSKAIGFLGALEHLEVGSSQYIETLARAYEHLQSAKDSQRE